MEGATLQSDTSGVRKKRRVSAAENPDECKVPLRAWCFTINNPTEADEAALRALGADKVARLVVGRETAPTTGTPHLQGYVRFIKSVRRGQCCLALGGRARVVPRNGTEEQASAYCMKDGEILINLGSDVKRRSTDEGESSKSAALRVIKMIDSGATPREVWRENRVFFMYNARRVMDEFARAKFYQANPNHDGFAPSDIKG